MTLRKCILFTALSGLLLLLLAGGLLVYFWTHPSALQSILEKQLSGSIGIRVRMDSLSYSLNPLKVRVQGFKFGEFPVRESGVFVSVSDFQLSMERTGGFAGKTLVLHPDFTGVAIHMSSGFDASKMAPGEHDPSFWGRIMTEIVGFLFFEKIRIGRVRLEQGRFDMEHSGVQTRLRKISAHLTAENRMVLSCRGNISHPVREIELSFPVMELAIPNSFSWSDPIFRARFRVDKGRLESPDLEAEDLDLLLDMEYERAVGKLGLKTFALGLSVEQSNLPVLKRIIPADVLLQGRGTYDPAHKQLTMNGLRLRSADVVDLQGALQIDPRDGSGFKLDIEHGRLQTAEILEAASFDFSEQLAGVSLSGPLEFTGAVYGKGQEAGLNFELDLRAGFKGLRLELSREELKLRTGLDGRIRFQGEWPGPLKMQGEISAAQTRLRGTGLELKPFSTSVSFAGSYPLFEIRDGKAEFPKVGVAFAEQQISFEPLALHVPEGSLDLRQGAVKIPALHIRSQHFEHLAFSLHHTDRRSEVKLLETDFRIGDLAQRLNVMPRDWKVQAAEDFALTLVQEQGKPVDFSTKLGFENLQFRNGPETMIGEGLRGVWRMSGRFARDASRFFSKISLDIERGEVLMDRFYLDLKQKPLSLSCSGEYALQEKLVSDIDLSFDLEHLLHFSTQGSLALQKSNPKFHLALSVPQTGLQPVFQTFVQEPFQMDAPFVSDIELEGRVGAELELDSREDGWGITGRCLLDMDHLNFQGRGIGFGRMNLDLPLWYQSEADAIPKSRAKGRAMIEEFYAPGLPEQLLQFDLKAGPNELILHKNKPLQTFGGGVLLGPLRITKPLSRELRVETRLELDNFSLEPALGKIFQDSIQGSLSGILDPVVLEKGAVQTRGGLRARVFKGLIDFFDIKAQNVFSPVPSFGLSAKLHGLDLTEMTTKTDFGKIQGVLEGSIEDLEIAAGQPQRFDMLLETVKTQGVDQKISVKAVDNIARIGGGQSPFMGFAGSLATIFQNFSYRKIGIKAHLENDRFQINGTIKEQGTEYLIKKSGLTGVNIVNSNPDNLISFKDMLRRIRRVASGEGTVRVE